jgi:hypothetical protein
MISPVLAESSSTGNLTKNWAFALPRLRSFAEQSVRGILDPFLKI